MIRTNYYYPQQLLDRLKLAKTKLGLPVSEIVRTAVERYLKELGV